jgi:hypothetical protein
LQRHSLAIGDASADVIGMWDEPYLETCCRSALHRVRLAADAGRPDGLKDGPCLHRLAGMGLVRQRHDGRFEVMPQTATAARAPGGIS